MSLWVVAHQLHVARLQRVVDIIYIGLDILRRCVQLSAHLTFVMVRLHHFRDISSGCDDAPQTAVLVAEGSHRYLIIDRAS